MDDVTGEANGAPFLIRGAYDPLELPTADAVVHRRSATTFRWSPTARARKWMWTSKYVVTDGKPALAAAISRSCHSPIAVQSSLLRNVVTQLQQAYRSPTTGGAQRGARRQSTPIGLDIAVKSTDTLSLDTNVGRVELSADLHVAGTLERPDPVGHGGGGRRRPAPRRRPDITYRARHGQRIKSATRRAGS